MPRTLYVTDSSALALGKAIGDKLTKRHKLKTKVEVMPLVLDAKLLSSSVFLRVIGAVPTPKGSSAAITYELVVPGGVLPGTLAYDDEVRLGDWEEREYVAVPAYEAVAWTIASQLAPFVDTPAKRSIELYCYNFNGETGKLIPKQFCDKLVDEMKAAGLQPSAIKRSVLDGEATFDEEDDRWRKKFWARLEFDVVNDSKLCLRGESVRNVTIGGMRNTYETDIKVKRPGGEDAAKTQRRLLDAIATELFPTFGAIPPKLRRDDAAILASFAGAPTKPSKAPTKAAGKAHAKARTSKPSSSRASIG